MIDYENVIKENSILQSNRLILRPFSIDDVDDVFLYASDDIVTKYLTFSTHKNKSETEKVVREFYMCNIGAFAIELKSEQKCIGCIELRPCIEHSKASFGYVLNKEYWNNNYMTEALNLILALSFSKLELNRIESTHYVGNKGSGRVMQKCGMKYEGTGRQELKIKGTFFDVVHYSILRDDWLNIKEKN